MSDCFAMGARPRAALALAVVPLAAERLMEEELFHMMVNTHTHTHTIDEQLSRMMLNPHTLWRSSSSA